VKDLIEKELPIATKQAIEIRDEKRADDRRETELEKIVFPIIDILAPMFAFSAIETELPMRATLLIDKLEPI
jgi:hypothetical protein